MTQTGQYAGALPNRPYGAGFGQSDCYNPPCIVPLAAGKITIFSSYMRLIFGMNKAGASFGGPDRFGPDFYAFIENRHHTFVHHKKPALPECQPL